MDNKIGIIIGLKSILSFAYGLKMGLAIKYWFKVDYCVLRWPCILNI